MIAVLCLFSLYRIRDIVTATSNVIILRSKYVILNIIKMDEDRINYLLSLCECNDSIYDELTCIHCEEAHLLAH